MIPRILITPGEPAGIGPDIVIQAAQKAWEAELVVVSDPQLMKARAKAIRMPLTLTDVSLDEAPSRHPASTLKIIPVTLKDTVIPGTLNANHAAFVVQTLKTAADLCLQKKARALVTGPVHKAIIEQGGIPFKGHTTFLETYCNVPQTLMLFVAQQLKVALLTTHLPLQAVPKAITRETLHTGIQLLHQGLKQYFHCETPRIQVAGLNPHAGEAGTIGREEIDILIPVLQQLRQAGYLLDGPYAADTLFTEKYLTQGDAILAMYHDQALPVVKHMSFGSLVNMTLGLPFLRTSVDHGVALDQAATGKANAKSLLAALKLAIQLTKEAY